jgi:hypothetical protein
VHNSAKEAQPLSDIVPVRANVVFGHSRIESQEGFHMGWLGKQVRSMARLRSLDGHASDKVENIFLAEKVEPPRPFRQLLVKGRIVAGL